MERKVKISEEDLVANGKINNIVWGDRPLGEIIDYIVKFYHDQLRVTLPELIFFSSKVEKVHAEHVYCPKGLTKKLQEIQEELFSHMIKEEQILFPLIKNGQGKHADMPIKVMREEHEMHELNLKTLRSLAFDYNPPDGACGTWRTLYTGLENLEKDLTEHILLENNTLFKRAKGQ